MTILFKHLPRKWPTKPLKPNPFFLPIELYSKVWVEDYSTPIDRKSSTLALFRTTDQRCLCPYDVYEEIFGAPPEAETVKLCSGLYKFLALFRFSPVFPKIKS